MDTYTYSHTHFDSNNQIVDTVINNFMRFNIYKKIAIYENIRYCFLMRKLIMGIYKQ